MTTVGPSRGLAHLRPQLENALQSIHHWFRRMQHPQTHRMMYKYLPYKRKHVFEVSPIRELGTCDTLLQLQQYTGSQEFDKSIQTTIDHYEKMLVFKEEVEGEEIRRSAGVREQGKNFRETTAGGKSWAFFSAEAVQEPSSIAHNAMMILALSKFTLYQPRGEENRKEILENLARGVLKQLNPATGKFAKIYFEPLEFSERSTSGWELYSGEAELALVAAYTVFENPVLWNAAYKAFEAYFQEFEQGSVHSSGSFIFYANWQCQAGRALFETCDSVEKRNQIVDCMLQLQNEVVITQQFFSQVASAPEMASVVQVACALEGLVATYACILNIEHHAGKERVKIYEKAIESGVGFLLLAQIKKAAAGTDEALLQAAPPPPENAIGGFGYSLQEGTQRVDVTGHVCDAFIRLLEVI